MLSEAANGWKSSFFKGASTVASGMQEIQKPTTLWHYTVKNALRQILAEGLIRPASPGLPKGQKGVVWFSAAGDWDPSANRWWRSPEGIAKQLGKDQTIVLGAGLARIGVSPQVANVDWNAYKEQSGVPTKVARALYDAAIKAGSRPRLWYATFASVPRSQWLAVEVWDDELGWVAQRF
jgi:hypothetical protein